MRWGLTTLLMLASLTACGSAGARSATATYRTPAVRAAFKHHGLPLRHGTHATFNSGPPVYFLPYEVPAHITTAGKARGGVYFQLYVFASARAAQSALKPSYLGYLRGARKPWRRLANVVLIAAIPVVPANHNAKIWRRAEVALASLR